MKVTYDIPNIRKTLKAINTLFNIPVFFLSLNGDNVASYIALGEQHFCFQAESHPELHKKCVDCDQCLLERCKKSHTAEWHFCHAGLFDGIVPILKNGIHVGYLFFGHVRTKDSKYSETITAKELQKAYDTLSCFSVDYLESLTAFLSGINFDKFIQINENDDAEEEFEKYFYDILTNYIHRNMDQDLSIASICDHFHVSRSFFYKKWCIYSDISFSDFVMQQRLNRAKTMIRETNLPIQNIATCVGFNTYSHFFYSFKKRIGMTPSQYKKKTS